MYEIEKKGEKFAAMWDVPLGTRIKVCAVNSGRCTKVRVLDRGPNRRLKARIIDLSKVAFAEIADPAQGLIQVEVTVLS